MRALFVIPLFLLAAAASADVTSDDVARALRKDLVHPYIFFTTVEKAALLERVKTSESAAAAMKRFTDRADRLVGEEVKPIGDTAPYAYQLEHQSAAFALAFVYQMTGDTKYARKSYDHASALAAVKSWIHPAHEFPVMYTRVWPWNVPDDQVNFGVDLGVANTGREIATVYDWIYPALSKPERDRIRGMLYEKVIAPMRGDYDTHWWASAYRCNWSGVCNAGVGITALALLSEHPDLTGMLAEAYTRIGRMLDQIDPDGGWQEGGAYWYYGIEMAVLYGDAMKRVTGGKLDLFAHPGLVRNAVNFPVYLLLPPRGTVNYGDSGNYRLGPSWLYTRLAMEGCRAAAWYYDNQFGGSGGTVYDLLWPRGTTPAALPEKPSLHFRGIDWTVMRTSFTDTNSVVLSCKAGKNDDPHHGHLDCGHFILSWRGRLFAADLGHSLYSQAYFSEARWENPYASSLTHNVVFVNGELQIPAKKKNTPWRTDVGGRILEFRSGAARDYTLMNCGGAYEGRKLLGWRRHLVLDKPDMVLILDEIASHPGAAVEMRVNTEAKPSAAKGYALLDGGGGAVMALIPAGRGIGIATGMHTNLPARANARTELPYVSVTTTAGTSGRTVLASVMLPVSGAKEAEAVVKSIKRTDGRAGNVRISFKRAGKTFEYRFRKGADGLTME